MSPRQALEPEATNETRDQLVARLRAARTDDERAQIAGRIHALDTREQAGQQREIQPKTPPARGKEPPARVANHEDATGAGKDIAGNRMPLTAAGGVIDQRLATLDKAAQGARSREELRRIGRERDELEDLVRGENAKRQRGVRRSPENSLTDEELQQAQQERADRNRQLEDHRQAVAAKNQADVLRKKLARIDNDEHLRALATQLVGGRRVAEQMEKAPGTGMAGEPAKEPRVPEAGRDVPEREPTASPYREKADAEARAAQQAEQAGDHAAAAIHRQAAEAFTTTANRFEQTPREAPANAPEESTAPDTGPPPERPGAGEREAESATAQDALRANMDEIHDALDAMREVYDKTRGQLGTRGAERKRIAATTKARDAGATDAEIRAARQVVTETSRQARMVRQAHKKLAEEKNRPRIRAPHDNDSEAALYSQSPIKSVQANIRRGREAMARALTDKADQHRAMYRQGLGWVDFVWGSTGGEPVRNGRKMKGKGLSHLIAERVRKDHLSQDDAEAVVQHMVNTIAKGREVARTAIDGDINARIDHDGYQAVLVKKKGSNSWLLTGFHKATPDDAGAIGHAPAPTHAEPTGNRLDMGAGDVESVLRSEPEGNEPRDLTDRPDGEVREEDLTPEERELVRQARADLEQAKQKQEADEAEAELGRQLERDNADQGEREARANGSYQLIHDELGEERMGHVHFVHDMDGVPEDVRKKARVLKKGHVRYGMHVPKGDIYIFTRHANTPAKALWTAWHENGHEAFGRIVENHPDVKVGSRTIRDAQKKARQFLLQNPTIAKLADVIRGQRGNVSREVAAEEATVELHAARQTGGWDAIERKYGVKVPERVRAGTGRAIDNFIRRMKAILNAVYAHVSGKSNKPFTDADVASLLEAMHEVGRGDRAEAHERMNQPDLDRVPFEPAPDGLASEGPAEHGRSERTRVPSKTAAWMGYPSATIEANYARLADKHPEYYSSPAEAERDVNHVLANPTAWYEHADGRIAIVRQSKDAQVPSVRIDFRQGPHGLRAVSAYRMPWKQVARKIRDFRKKVGSGQSGYTLSGEVSPGSLTIADYLEGAGNRSRRPTQSSDAITEPRGNDTTRQGSDGILDSVTVEYIEDRSIPSEKPVKLPPRAPGESREAWHARIVRENRKTLRDGVAGALGLPTGEAKRMRDLGRGDMRAMWSSLQRAQDKAAAAFSTLTRVFDKAGRAVNLKSIHEWETGQRVTSAAHRLFFDLMDKQFNARVERIRSLAPGTLEHVIENYFPHLWKDPTKAAKWYQSMQSRAPLEGSKSFLKQRVHDTIADGMKAGLEPVSTNPVDLVLVKMAQMDKFIALHEFRRDLQQRGWLKEMGPGQRVPYGYAKVDDPAFMKAAGLQGYFAVPEYIAKDLNNYLGPSLYRFNGFKAFRKLQNVIMMSRLGWSAFHAGFTSLDNMVMHADVAGRYALQGDIGRALTTLVKTPLSIVWSPFEGGKINRQWLGLDKADGNTAALLDALEAGGARYKMSRSDYNNDLPRFLRSLRQRDYKTSAKTVFSSIGEAGSWLIHHKLVPNQKMAARMMLAKSELDRFAGQLGKKRGDYAAIIQAMHPDALKQIIGNVVQVVDDRLGQMNYDNRFWNKTARELSQTAIGAVGWQVGTVKTVTGGLRDIERMWNPEKLLAPLDKEGTITDAHMGRVSGRLTYLISLALIQGSMNAITQYLLTGQGPTEIKDYFFPKTGRKNADGSWERLQFPTYWMDHYKLATAPFQTMEHKVHPIFGMMMEAFSNEDYFGVRIRDKNAPWYKQAEQVGEYVAKGFVPYSWSNSAKISQNTPSLGRQAASFVGVTDAPASVSRDKFQEFVAHNGTKGFDNAVRTPAEAKRSRSMHEAETALRQGKTPDLSGFTARDKRTIYRQARIPVPEHRFKRLSIQDKLRAYDMATPTERREYHLKSDLLRNDPRRTVAFQTADPNEQRAIMKRLAAIARHP